MRIRVVESLKLVYFFLFLNRYIYCGQTDVQHYDLMQTLQVLHASKKFQLPVLSKVVIDNLITTKIDKTNVFEVYEQVNQYNETELNDKIDLIVQFKSDLLADEQTIATINRSSIDLLIKQPRLSVSELNLFEFTVAWANKQLEVEGVFDKNPDMLRTIIGDALFQLRLPTLSVEDFIQAPMKSQMFSDREALDIMLYQIDKDKPINGIVNKFHLQSRASLKENSLELDHPSRHSDISNDIIREYEFMFKSSSPFCLKGFEMHSLSSLTLNGKIYDKETPKVLHEFDAVFENENSDRHTHQIVFNDCILIKTDQEIRSKLSFSLKENYIFYQNADYAKSYSISNQNGKFKETTFQYVSSKTPDIFHVTHLKVIM